MAVDATARGRAAALVPARDVGGRFAALMNLPTLVCLGLVLAYPVVYAGYLSVHRVGLGAAAARRVPVHRLGELRPRA